MANSRRTVLALVIIASLLDLSGVVDIPTAASVVILASVLMMLAPKSDR